MLPTSRSEMKILAVFTVICTLHSVWCQVESSVLEDNFVLIAAGKRMIKPNCTLATRMVDDDVSCATLCIEDQNCFGINYYEVSKSCELLSRNLNLGESEDDENCTIFHRKIDCRDEPCHKNAMCEDKNETMNDYRGYTCTCDCGWCGWNCDIINFGVIENKCIPMYNGGFKEVEAVKECMEFCSDTPGCRSSDYLFTDKGEKQCWLNLVDDTTVDLDSCDDIPKGYSIGYAYFNCTCPEEVSIISV